MKVAIEAQRLFRPHKFGMDVVAYELLRRLPVAQDRHEYHLLVKKDDDMCIAQKDLRTIHAMSALPYPVWEQALLPRYCSHIKADVLHCTSNTAPLITRQPLLLTLHDLIFFDQSYLRARASYYQRLGNAYRSFIAPAITKKAVGIITVSEYQKGIISDKLSVPAEKIDVIHNGVDERFFVKHTQEAVTSVVSKYKLTPGYIFFMANTEPRKNTRGVLKAYSLFVKQYANAPRMLIKGITQNQLLHLLKSLNLLSLQPHIDLIQYVGYEELPFIYQGASMLWFPSFSEGFGLPIIEAMASGLPVVTSRMSSMPEISGGATLLIDPYHPQQIADAAVCILDNKEATALLIEKGRKRAECFTWTESVKKLVQVYDKIEQLV